jgi:hypothetical protein
MMRKLTEREQAYVVLAVCLMAEVGVGAKFAAVEPMDRLDLHLLGLAIQQHGLYLAEPGIERKPVASELGREIKEKRPDERAA